MRTGIVSSSELLRRGSLAAEDYLGRGVGPRRHTYRAYLEGRAIRVVDAEGKPVEGLTFGGTLNNRTCYAHVAGVGFIGGWTYPHRALPWPRLADYINLGFVYSDQNDLPKRPPKTFAVEHDGLGVA